MRRIITVLLICIIVCTLCNPIQVHGASSTEHLVFEDKYIEPLLTKKITDEHRVLIEEALGFNISDAIIIPYYMKRWKGDTLFSLKELLRDEEKRTFDRYLIITNKIYAVIVYHELEQAYVGRLQQPGEIPRSFQELFTLTKNININGQDVEIRGIYVFPQMYHSENVVYLDTNKGVWVKYYEHMQSEPIVLSEEDYIAEMALYHIYKTADEDKHAFETFARFRTDPERYLREVLDKGTSPEPTITPTVQPTSNCDKWLLFVGVAMVIAMIGFPIYIRTKKNK